MLRTLGVIAGAKQAYVRGIKSKFVCGGLRLSEFHVKHRAFSLTESQRLFFWFG